MSAKNDSALIFKTIDEMYAASKKVLERIEKTKDLGKILEKKKDVVAQIKEVDEKISDDQKDINKVRFLCERYKELILKLDEDDEIPFDVEPKEEDKKAVLKKAAKSLKDKLKF